MPQEFKGRLTFLSHPWAYQSLDKIEHFKYPTLLLEGRLEIE